MIKLSPLIFLLGCGAEPSVAIAVSQQALLGNIASVDLFVLDKTTCATATPLLGNNDVLFEELVAFAPTARFTSLPPGKSLTVVAEAYGDAEGKTSPIAEGCVDNVTLDAGATRSVTLVLGPVQ